MSRKTDKTGVVYTIIQAVIIVIILAVIAASIINVSGDGRLDGCRQLESSVRRSVMACYASEGVYPPNVDYLVDHYNLQLDNDRYTVHYSVFAQNLMPDITVTEKTR